MESFSIIRNGQNAQTATPPMLKWHSEKGADHPVNL